MYKDAINISILGGGESGIGAALLAQKQGKKPFLSDMKPLKEKYRAQLTAMEILFEEGGHNEEKILASDLIIKSPGIPEKAPLIKKIREKGIPLVSEIEYASWFCPGKIIAITGSNGKTTTTLLTYHILKKAGLKVAVAGNVGNSFAGELLGAPKDYYVLEVSSFQLDDIIEFAPHIAILTNITPDHLDRYDYKYENYIASKFKIAQNQTANDYFIINQDDVDTMAHLKNNTTRAQILPISIEKEVEFGAYTTDQNIIQINTKNQQTMSINELALQGKHNTYNSMASGLAAKLLSIRKETIRESLADFESIEHRMEPVLKVYGIQFVNDSKATNVNSTWYALESTQHPIVWIAGGVDKGNDYSQLFSLVKSKVKALVCLGVDNSKLHQEFGDKVPMIIDAADMSEAVRIAYKLGEKDDTVLLSPACASFDLFENYEDRGRQFKEAVRNL